MTDKRTAIARAVSLAAVASLMAGPVVSAVFAAAGIGCSGFAVWAFALLAAALTVVASFLRGGLIAASAVFIIGGGAALGLQLDKIIEALRSAEQVAVPGYAAGGAAVMLSALFVLLMHRRTGTPAAIGITLTAVILSAALSARVSVLTVAPAIVAAVMAFAQARDVLQDASIVRSAIPAVLAVALALLIAPGEGVTWRPLEQAAEQVQAIFTDYFRFTEERLAFTIRDEGYDHAGYVNDVATGKLGGPANPHDDPVMTVETDSTLLLRGTIRSEYTGYSWEDNSVRSRDLYYNFLKGSHRDRVFDAARTKGMDVSGAFRRVAAAVTLEREATSTLFAPGRLMEFSMQYDTAVYYNEIGELFLPRNAGEGDRYSFVAEVPVAGEALERLISSLADGDDPDYADIRDVYTALPQGISGDLYALVSTMDASCLNDYQLVQKVMEYLARNCAYTLTPDYPPEGVDFVSHFVLESKEGYCSYFASAMAVMCRMAGVPARYVEGYRVEPEADGITLVTGESAHAWVEVYFKGLGWVAFDPTRAAQEGTSQSGEGESSEGDALPTPTPTPTPNPTLPPVPPEETEAPADMGSENPTPTPTLPPEGDDNPFDEPTPPPEEPENEPEDEPETPPEDEPESDRDLSFLLWLLLPLVLLLLLAGAYLWAKKRLHATDPGQMVKKCPDSRAPLIVYRAILTELLQMGQAPAPGETPVEFANRVTALVHNPDFVRFSSALSRQSYAGTPMDNAELSDGLRAYAIFANRMRKSEKLRHSIHRIFKGNGSVDVIP